MLLEGPYAGFRIPNAGGATAPQETLTLPEQHLTDAIAHLQAALGGGDRSLRAADAALIEALDGLGAAPAALQCSLEALAFVREINGDLPSAARAVGLRLALGRAQEAFRAIRREGLDPLAGERVTVEPGGLQFGEMCVGETKSLTFTVTNKTAVARQVDFSGLGTDVNFALESGLPANLAPGASAQVTVRCHPGQPVEVSKALRLAAPGVGGEPDAGVFVSMSVIAHAVKVEPHPVEFGEVEVGSTKDITVTVTNCLNVEFKGKMELSGPEFTWAGQGARKLKLTLAAHAAQQFTLRYTPVISGEDTGEINVNMHKFNIHDLEVPVHGTGKQPVSVGPNKIDFGVVPRNQFQNRSFTISNDTAEPTEVQVDTSKLPSVYFLVSPSGPVKVAPHSSTPVNIRFGSTGACKHKGKILITSPRLPGGKAAVSVAVQAR